MIYFVFEFILPLTDIYFAFSFVYCLLSIVNVQSIPFKKNVSDNGEGWLYSILPLSQW